MTQASRRRGWVKAGWPEEVQAGLRAYEAARARIEDRQSESDGAAPATRGDALAKVATATAAPPSSSTPGSYEMPYGKFAGWRLRDIWFEDGGPEYVANQRRFLLRTAPGALAAIEAWFEFLQSHTGGAGASPEGSPPLNRSGPRRLSFDANAPACVKAHYGERGDT